MSSKEIELEAVTRSPINLIVRGYHYEEDDQKLLPLIDDYIPPAAGSVTSRACCSLSSFLALCRRHLIITASTVFVVLSVIIFMMLTCAPTCVPAPFYFTAATKQTSDVSYTIALLGDSLISGDHRQNYAEFPLIASKIASFLPYYSNLNFLNFGDEGDCINDIRVRLGNVMISSADAVILLWDSDVSNFIETPDNIDNLRGYYVSNLTYVITALQKNNPAVRIAIGGPGLLGEGPLFMGEVTSDTYHEKKIMLNDYSAINQQIASDYNITYIDLRRAYLQALPNYRLAYSGCLTIDGEHENDNGLTIISKLIAQVVYDFMNV